jgi:hypothetical protein
MNCAGCRTRIVSTFVRRRPRDFGHYLVEALSVGAVTLTLDAAPMNELITVERGALRAGRSTGTQHLAATNFFDEAENAASDRADDQSGLTTNANASAVPHAPGSSTTTARSRSPDASIRELVGGSRDF